jgi:SAM-dependent methyltransferase
LDFEQRQAAMKPTDPFAGDWQKLDAANQVPRYEAIERLLRAFHAQQNVLDIGCGEAVLRAFLPRDATYVGLEISPVAARNASARYTSTATIVCADAERYTPPLGTTFHGIVFNEMLYYMRDPASLLQRYAALLSKHGVMVVSIFRRPESWLDRGRRWLAQGVKSTKPVSNRHCLGLVQAQIGKAGWRVRAQLAVPIPGTSLDWMVMVIDPHDVALSRA